MSYAPYVVTIGGMAVEGWTSSRLRRARKEMTGELTLECFYGSIPASPVLSNIAAGAEIQVLVAGQVAFTGTIDRRNGRGKKRASERGSENAGANADETFQRAVSIGRDSYTITITARGKAKRLVDCSHDHKKGMMQNTTVPEIFRELTKNFKVELDDRSNDQTKIERAVFRDGGLVHNELRRWGTEANLNVFETREGKLALTAPGQEQSGVPLILGQNILEFSCEQSEDDGVSEVTVKGQRTDPTIWGKDAIMRQVQATLQGITGYAPLTVQLSGDASDERLKTRGKVEARKRQEGSKTITIDVFNVQSGGAPWDIDVRHYVEVPPEGIFDEFVVDELVYDVDEEGKLKTTLTLVPSDSGGGGGLGGMMGGMGMNFGGGGSGGGAARSDAQALGNARKRAAFGDEAKSAPDWSMAKVEFGDGDQ